MTPLWRKPGFRIKKCWDQTSKRAPLRQIVQQSANDDDRCWTPITLIARAPLAYSADREVRRQHSKTMMACAPAKGLVICKIHSNVVNKARMKTSLKESLGKIRPLFLVRSSFQPLCQYCILGYLRLTLYFRIAVRRSQP
jgi:hypothetical protein